MTESGPNWGLKHVGWRAGGGGGRRLLQILCTHPLFCAAGPAVQAALCCQPAVGARPRGINPRNTPKYTLSGMRTAELPPAAAHRHGLSHPSLSAPDVTPHKPLCSRQTFCPSDTSPIISNRLAASLQTPLPPLTPSSPLPPTNPHPLVSILEVPSASARPLLSQEQQNRKSWEYQQQNDFDKTLLLMKTEGEQKVQLHRNSRVCPRAVGRVPRAARWHELSSHGFVLPLFYGGEY